MFFPPSAAPPVPPPPAVLVENGGVVVARHPLLRPMPSPVTSGAVSLDKVEMAESPQSIQHYDDTKEVDNFLSFISRPSPGQHGVPLEVSAAANDLWRAVQDEFGASLPVPLLAAGDDAGVMVSWDRKEHHLSVEIGPQGCEVFYRDRDDDESAEYHWLSFGRHGEIVHEHADLFDKLALTF